MSKNAVIFDWNGTIFDDAEFALAATNASLASLGVPAVTLEAYQAAYTIPLSQAYKKLGCSDEQVKDKDGKLTGTFFAHYEKIIDKARVRKGTKEVLAFLKTNDFKTAILSNYVKTKIEAHAIQADIQNYLDDILALTDRPETPFHKAGKGEWLQHYVKTHKIKNGIVVGDTIEEIEIARHHNFKSIVITGGTCSKSRLSAANPDYLIDDFRDIMNISQEVFGC